MHSPLPIGSAEVDQVKDPWQVEQQPATLIAFWPEANAPSELQVIAALQQQFNQLFEKLDQLSDGLWNGVYRTPISESPAIIWLEAAKPIRGDEVLDTAARNAKWIVGVETMLTDPNWIDEYTAWLRALASGLGVTTILDPTTLQYWQNPRLNDLIAPSPAELHATDLWTIHAVGGSEASKPCDGWIHTHGLWRCGRPELEMLEVPNEHTAAAARFLNEVAQLLLFSGAPESGQVFELGPDLSITLHPWQEIAPNVSPHNSGKASDRTSEDDPHAGARAVICGAKPRGLFRKLWTWPEEAIHTFAGGDAIVFRAPEQSERQSRLAVHHCHDLAMAFAGLPQTLRGPTSCMFLLKSPLGEESHREFMWFEVLGFQGDSIECKLLNVPRFNSRIKAGDVVAIAQSNVTDWMVQMHAGQFGPADVPAMWRAIDQLKATARRP